MNHTKKLSDLDLFLLNTRTPEQHEIGLVEKSFILWKNVWEDAFKELQFDIGKSITSDDFLFRDAIVLFCQDEPVALALTHPFAVRESHLSHSYFKNYPENVKKTITGLGIDEALILSYITCHPEWRKKYTDVPMSELLFSLAVKKFESTHLQYMIGYARKDLGVHDIYYRHGGYKLSDSHAYNVDVDFICMSKKTKKLSPVPGVAETAEHLWSKMINKQHNVTKLAA